ncbi:VWA domain-containing protein [Candidatus Woesearchaeota archaeon]|nr:VWA domain-containing protein [Candidatus Woesearchaeota archaeon]
MFNMIYPERLYWLAPIIVAMIVLLSINFVKGAKAKKNVRLVVFIVRGLIFALLVLALAVPYEEVNILSQGNPRVTAIIDNSASMQAFNYNPELFLEKLNTKIPVSKKYINTKEMTRLGDAVLKGLGESDNILVISDGQNTEGSTLLEAALEASVRNASIYALQLESIISDASISIQGPSKVVSGVETTYTVNVNKLGFHDAQVKVKIDGTTVYDETTIDEQIFVTRSFEKGYHKIEAEVIVDEEEDHFSNNNKFYMTIKVIDKPKILYVTETDSPLNMFLEALYEPIRSQSIPGNISQYLAVIIEDMPAGKLNPKTELLKEYLTQGNGILVIGGYNSFERDDYKNSMFETILPVTVGSTVKKRADADLMIVIDISGSAQGVRYNVTPEGLVKIVDPISQIDVMKAFAVNIVKQLRLGHGVGALAFSTKAYKIADVRQLYEHKPDLIDKLSRLKVPEEQRERGDVDSNVYEGILAAYEKLNTQSREKNIILMTDGQVAYRAQTLELVKSMAKEGIKVYTIGVARNPLNIDEQFLQDLAEAGYGFYVGMDESNKINVLFGDPGEVEQGQSFDLLALNTNHFITRDINIRGAKMNGFNRVTAKRSARELIVSTPGDAALTVWNFAGLGKVAAITVNAGGTLGPLLEEKHSIITSRTINWLIGDPERKTEYILTVPDTRVNVPTYVSVKSDKHPVSEELTFSKVSENLFLSNALVSEEPGFANVLDAVYAVNYPLEYEKIGFNGALEHISTATGGKIFKDSEIEEMAEQMIKNSRRMRKTNIYFHWALIMTAIILFLFEIAYRKMHERKDA